MPATNLIFSERGQSSLAIPKWAEFLINVGLNWPLQPNGPRRMVVISMPCDSAGAGLAMLGAMARRMESPEANDLSFHWAKLHEYAQDHSKETILRKQGSTRKYILKGTRTVWGETMLCAREIDTTTNLTLTFGQKSSRSWTVVGQAAVEEANGTRISFAPILRNIRSPALNLLPENLERSESVICFAGRNAGETATRATVHQLALRVGATTAKLDQLLSIKGWDQACTSRVVFYNSRTKQLDRSPRQIQLT